MKIKIFLLFGSVSLYLVIIELIFQIIAPKSPPGTTYGKSVHRNSDWFRDKDFAIPKPEKTYRILVLGDSFTWGVGIDVNETIPKQLEQNLTPAYPNKNIEVVNAAIPGFNTVEQLVLLKEKGLKYKPNMIILVYNLNDIEFLPHYSTKKYDKTKIIPEVEADPGENISEVLKEKGFRAFIRWFENRSQFIAFLVPRIGHLLRSLGLLNSLEFSWVERIFQGYNDENPGWIEAKAALHEISETSRSRGIVFIVTIYPLLANLRDYKGKKAHEFLHGQLNNLGILFVDLLNVFEGKNGQSYWVNYMDGHPNEEAHRLATQAILLTVKNHIR